MEEGIMIYRPESSAADGYQEGSSSFAQSYVSDTVAPDSLSNMMRNITVFVRLPRLEPEDKASHAAQMDEDEEDVRDALAALSEPDGLSWLEIKARHHL
jgi:hypothetical protein